MQSPSCPSVWGKLKSGWKNSGLYPVLVKLVVERGKHSENLPRLVTLSFTVSVIPSSLSKVQVWLMCSLIADPEHQHSNLKCNSWLWLISRLCSFLLDTDLTTVVYCTRLWALIQNFLWLVVKLFKQSLLKATDSDGNKGWKAVNFNTNDLIPQVVLVC